MPDRRIKFKDHELLADGRILLQNQDLWIDGRWVGHLFVSGQKWHGALPGLFFTGTSQKDVALQMLVAWDEIAAEKFGAKPCGQVAEAPADAEPAGGADQTACANAGCEDRPVGADAGS